MTYSGLVFRRASVLLSIRIRNQFLPGPNNIRRGHLHLRSIQDRLLMRNLRASLLGRWRCIWKCFREALTLPLLEIGRAPMEGEPIDP